MLLVVWLLNFAISWFNAWSCGRSWDGSKAAGGLAHLMTWCGAIMSASGFTWCYTLLLAYVGQIIPIDQDDGTVAALVSAEQAKLIAELGYLVIIGPIIGSGLVITVQSWMHFLKRKTIANGGITAWNTFAMGNNLYSAYQTVPGVWGSAKKLFSGDDDNKSTIVLLVVLLAVLGGVFTTRSIISSTRNKVRGEAFREQEAEC